MVNDAETLGIDPAAGHPERALALGYAPAGARAGVTAAFALDATLARLALGTRDPMVAQLRLTWWYESLANLHLGETAGQPILRALASSGADGKALAIMEEGWERLLGTPEDDELAAFARARGVLFHETGRLAGAGDAVSAAGEGWALADLARATGDPALAARAARLAAPLLAEAAAQRWSVRGRFLGALVHIARADLAARHPIAAPRRVARLAWHKLTGR
jgi:phytoene synthase